MKQQNVTPRFATLQYDVLHTLDISIAEYFYLDMVYYLSRNGWCYKSNTNIASDMNMHRNGVQKMKDRLVKAGLLKRSIKGYVKTTDTYHLVCQQPSRPAHLVTNQHTKYAPDSTLSVPKNNIRITKNKEIDNFREKETPSSNPNTFASARRVSDTIRERYSFLKGKKPSA